MQKFASGWKLLFVLPCRRPGDRYLRALRLERRAHAPQVCVGGPAAAGDGLSQLDAAGGAEERGERHGDGGAPPDHALRPGVPAPVGGQRPQELRPSLPPAPLKPPFTVPGGTKPQGALPWGVAS